MDGIKYEEESSITFNPLEKSLDLLHCVVGAGTEVGELADAFKKHIYYGDKLDAVNVAEEIGDIQWYLANLLRLLKEGGYGLPEDMDLDKTRDINIAKLRKRYGSKFSEAQALNRDLGSERETLEGGN